VESPCDRRNPSLPNATSVRPRASTLTG